MFAIIRIVILDLIYVDQIHIFIHNINMRGLLE